jgi:hypothetical protein
MTQRAPSRSLGWNARSITRTSRARIASLITGAITVTLAPAASSPSSLLAATVPPPTSTTGKPANLKNTG